MNINHNWIKHINVSRLAKRVQQRLLSGIAGTRFFYIFKSYNPKNINDKSPVLINVFNIVRDVALKGPFYEMHPFFIPVDLSSISISKNLSNLIIDIYNTEEIGLMIKNKNSFEKPIFDTKFNN